MTAYHASLFKCNVMLLCCTDVDCAPGLPEMAMTSGVGENNNAICDRKCSTHSNIV